VIITTRYIGATDTKCARISAICRNIRIEVPYRTELEPISNHIAAARRLAEKHGFGGLYAYDKMWEKPSYVFVRQREDSLIL
jgi:hypothetical protein